MNVDKLSPDFNEFFIGLNRLIPASVKGLPAQSRFLDQTRNLLAQLDPFLRNFNPFLRFLGLYKREIAAMLANDTATTQATDQIGEDRVHYLRLTSPVNPESLATYPSRQDWFRGNPYYKPGNYDQLEAACRCSTAATAGTTGVPHDPGEPEPGGGVPQPDPPVRPERREHRRAAVPRAGPVHGRRGDEHYPHVRTDPQAEPVGALDRFGPALAAGTPTSAVHFTLSDASKQEDACR